LLSEVRDAQRAVDDANRVRDEFVAAVSQELRNPLAPMQMVLDGADHDDVRSVLRNGVEAVTRIVDDLAFIAELNAGLTLVPRRVELSRVVEAGIRRAAQTIEAREHTLDVAVADTGVRVHADLDRLANVVASLLQNAAQHSPAGSLLRIEAVRDGTHVALHVTDPGSGISKENLVDLFDPIARARRCDRRAKLGLGLFVAQRTVALHDGTLHVDSEVGRGSRFTIRLPLIA
jgi:signal transduction histidine kinase